MSHDTLIRPHPHYLWVINGKPETAQSICEAFNQSGYTAEIAHGQPTCITLMATGLAGVNIRITEWVAGDEKKAFQPTEW